MVTSTSGFSCVCYFAFVLLLFLIAVPVSLCIAKRRWFITDSGIGNPYKEVARVVSFARKQKIPIRRSAFTYWEDDIPTGLDLGKSKYGGPFTTEQVENVKSFFWNFVHLALTRTILCSGYRCIRCPSNSETSHDKYKY